MQNFYNIVPHWDDFLHGSNGIMTGLLGFMIVPLFDRNRETKMNLPPIFIAVFAFCFAVCIGGIWEIYEFSMDGIFGLNMQKFIQQGETLNGHLAIADTMKDIIVDSCGAFIASLIGYYSLKHKNANLNTKKDAKNAVVPFEQYPNHAA